MLSARHLLARLVVVLLLATTLTSRAARAEPTPPAPRIDLNAAPAAVLITLPGIGPKRAAEILRRRKRRPFRRLRDLLKIRGIGPRTLRKIAERAEVRPLRPTSGGR